ncbi:MAG: hypothetical protein ACK2UQ_08830 [Anaerolineae bacterium]|jgi:hypothetical protein
MTTYHMSISIQITPATERIPFTVTEQADGGFHCVISEVEATSIDRCEQALLDLTYPAVRQALATHLSAVSLERARAQGVAGTVREDPHLYRVDGEVGRFEFTTYWIDRDGWCVYNTAREVFPPLGSKEWYLTHGYKELAMMTGATGKSYRKTTSYLNRFRHQENDGTPVRTLREQTRREGEALQQAIEQQVETLFEVHHIPRSGLLTALPQGLPIPVETTRESPLVVEALTVCQTAAPGGTCLKDNPVAYEVPRTTVNVCLDDVGTKRQKAIRAAVSATSEAADTAKTVQHTVAHVEQAGRRYVLTGSGLMATLRVLIALFVHNSCLGYRLQFFTDGYRSLQKTIRQVFAWHPSVVIILDWYHLHKKCANQLSLAMTGRDVRNAALKPLLHLLWYGLVDQAIAAIKALDRTQVKNVRELEGLIGYLERNRPNIPCYAVRKRLGLRNSSQLGEKMNDLVVADRQKRRGMSWSEAGSVALASLTALVKNGEIAHWLQEGRLKFKLAA